jgi:hypothetical protein
VKRWGVEEEGERTRATSSEAKVSGREESIRMSKTNVEGAC